MSTTDLAQAIPAKWRSRIYLALGTVFTIESTLDAFGYGFIPAQPQGAAVAVLSALGFGVAFKNVSK